MLARTEAKIRAKEAEIQSRIEGQKSTASSWRRGDAPPRDDAWRSKNEPKEEKKADAWRAGMYCLLWDVPCSVNF